MNAPAFLHDGLCRASRGEVRLSLLARLRAGS